MCVDSDNTIVNADKLHRYSEVTMVGLASVNFVLNRHFTIVRLMSQCNRIFGDIIFTFCPIKRKFSSIISTF